MDGDDLVLFSMVRAHGDEVVSLGVLELEVSNIGFKLEPDPEPFPVLLWILFIIVPLVVISLSRLTDKLLSYFFSSLGVFPNHYLDGLSMAEPDHVVSVPTYGQNRFLVLFTIYHSWGQHLPNHQETALVACT